jgi:hypothetical protein
LVRLEHGTSWALLQRFDRSEPLPPTHTVSASSLRWPEIDSITAPGSIRFGPVLGHDAMNDCRRLVQIDVERRERLSQAFAPLRPCRVLDEVLGDETECGVVSKLSGLVKGQQDLFGRHCVITQEAGLSMRS